MGKKKQKAEPEEFFAAIVKATQEAAKEARCLARMHGTKMWLMKDGKIVGLKP